MLLLQLLLLGVTVRIEADGVRVGAELVKGADRVVRAAGKIPVLVSGSDVQNASTQGAMLEVTLAAGDRKVTLAPGIRLLRVEGGYRLDGFGEALVIQAGGETWTSPKAGAAFALTEKGFDFGALAKFDGPAFTVRLKESK